MKTKIINLIFLTLLCLSIRPAVGGPTTGDQEAAQLVSDGNAFSKAGKPVEALWAYRQAARLGNVAGTYAAGDLLLCQSRSSRGKERILKSVDGIHYLFLAATNRQPQACAALSRALQTGTGVQSNLVSAYAWLLLAHELDPKLKRELDCLVVQLDEADIHKAQALASEYQMGHWPIGLDQPVDQSDPRLRVQGMTISTRGTLVVVNNTTLAPGDTATVRPANQPGAKAADRLTITCRETGTNYVLVTVAGEPNLKLLSTEKFSKF